ncbi:MAG: hypothetical protein KDC98_02375 [Planctomycetes bacterium]|nr:hypothetical protein [Planctomycetota bacterium]
MLLALACGAGSTAQQRPPALLAGLVADGSAAVEDRCAALARLQDEGRLEVDAMVTALRAGGDLGAMAAAIVRHEWVEVPAQLLDGIAADAAAVGLLLRELALAPRPSLENWVRSQVVRDKLPIGLRCLALAASGRRLSRDEAAMLVQAAQQEDVGDGYRTAIWLLEPGLADGLLGRLHALLLRDGADVSRLMPFFERLSDAGIERLLGLAVTLPEVARRELARHFVTREAPAYRKRVEAALDGEIPLEAIWLMRADRLLDRRPRIDRLIGLLTAEPADEELRGLAFENLVAARVLEPPVVAFANEGPDRQARIRKVVEAGIDQFDSKQILAWLHDATAVAQATAAALLRRPSFEPELEQAVRGLLEGAVVQGPAQTFAVLLLQRGGPQTVTAIWPDLVASPLFEQFADSLARRKAPWVHELLLTELLREPRPEEVDGREDKLDAVRLALVAMGDRRELDQLVERAPRSRPVFVRRCSHYADPLDSKHSLQLLDAAAGLDDDDLAVELIAWAATTRDAEVDARLLAQWRQPELGERHLAALHGLALGASRPGLVESLQRALAAGPLDDHHDAMCYELISTMPTPLARADVELLAELALLLPLQDPVAEQQRGQRWPDGRFGFPLVAAVGHRLRGGDPVLLREVFAAAADRALRHPAVASLARARLLVLWRSLIPDPEVQSAIGMATAKLMLALPPVGGAGEGPARVFLMRVAEQQAAWNDAAEHARRAVAALLRHPDDRGTARLFLGERDPGAGVDPCSALSALPLVFAARAALAAGDGDAARAALATAADLAGRDRMTRDRIEELSKD